ncbi:MAG: DUF2723 domain-containing protein [Bacteroidota bacterium]
MSFKILNNLFGWLICVIAIATYCLSMEPTASFWDCGEYIACAYRLEIGHPPGAPFFMLLGRFFSLFGGSDPSVAAALINIMSACCSGFAIMFLFWSITRLGIKIYGKNASDLSRPYQLAVISAGAVGALAFTFSDTFWFNAVEGEVYAMSSLFTAMVFWAILKWDEEDNFNPAGAMRWLVLICYLIGLSIGVHLLSLLTIPALCYVFYFKKYKFTWKSFLIAGIFSVFLLFFVQNLIIPKIVKFLADYEVFFTNKLKTGFNSGTVTFFLLLVFSLVMFILYSVNKKNLYYKMALYTAITFAGLAVITAPGTGAAFYRLMLLGGMLYLIHRFRTKTVLLNTVFLGFAALLIGYSSFFVLVIRSQANTPMDENDPENAPNMLSYLIREQYGEAPLLYGPYYNSPLLPKSKYGDADPVYTRDKKNKNYRVLDSRKKSVHRYEKEFCTFFPRMYSNQQQSHIEGYKYWGNVSEHHRNRISNDHNGEAESLEVPTMAANLTFFFNYQVVYMYLRYFFWNFVGRQNDFQGVTGNNMDGNWLSGIKAVDDFKLGTDTSKTIYRDKNNFANNHFYGLPLILGLCGMFFHFKRNKPDAWVVMCFFLLTGLAIIVYLNQSPYQVRERDYAYVGSFYAFAIWIGLGVLFLFDQLVQKKMLSKALIPALLAGMVVPVLMAKEGWNDHNRSLRTLSRDTAINYLQSCAPNAILFTNGDNDTFPLWYAQEVENIRTDVRVVCMSLLNADWFIKQVRRAAYLSKPVPFTIPEEKLEGEKMNFIILDRGNTQAVNLKEAMAVAGSDDPATKIENDGELLDVLPSGRFYVDVDSSAIAKNKVIAEKETARLEKRISWDFGNRSYIFKNEMMVLDLIANNTWERPVYFTSNANDACAGLRKYLRLEGLTYRLVPIRQNEQEEMEGGQVNTEVMYTNVMTKLKWGGMNKKGVNLDENCLRMPMNLRMQMGILANALVREGKPEKASAVLNKCLTEMPEETVPYDATLYNICRVYYELGDTDTANKISKKLFDIFEGDLGIYNSQEAKHKTAYRVEINQAIEILKSLTGMSQQYKQNDLSSDYNRRLARILPPNELRQAEMPELIP